MSTNQARQGDLFFLAIDESEIPAGAVVVGNGNFTLQFGEATGHAHVLEAPASVTEILQSGGFTFIKVFGEMPAEVVHPEHGKITLQPGVHKMIRQQEFVQNRMVDVLD